MPWQCFPALARTFFWIADNSPLASTQRQIRNCRFPRHPACKSPDRIRCLIRMKPDSPLGWTAGEVVLNAVSVKNTGLPGVHFDGKRKFELPLRPQQKVQGCLVEVQQLCRSHYLDLGDFK